MTELTCDCGLPWARIENGSLVVVARHRGETHTNTISIMELGRLWLGNDFALVFGLVLQLVEAARKIDVEVNE
jgi:hypothetical protein